jgi:hypothetical protein
VLDEDETWAVEDVPTGPYFHGSRAEIPFGEYLRPGEVDPGGGDTRLRALAVPIFGSYALAEYERARQMATLDLISLDQMRGNAGAITSTTPAALNPSDTQPDQP